MSSLFSIFFISLTGAMSPGPMTAVTVSKALNNPWAGTLIAIGHAIIEIPLMLLIYFGLGSFFEYEITQILLYILGGAMLIWIGISLFKSRNADISQGKIMQTNSLTAGILMSLLNPYLYIWWLTVGGLLTLEIMEGKSISFLPVFYIFHWSTDLIWMSLLSIIIFKTRHLFGNKIQYFLYLISGIFLVGFGIYYWINGFKIILG